MKEEKALPPAAAGVDDDAPLRAELFTAAQMAVHGRRLAARHQLADAPGSDRLLDRLDDNAAVIADACAGLACAARAGVRLPPAADALLDHAWLIDDHVHRARRDLPDDDCRALPCLQDPDASGNPRVYQLALEVIAHGDGRLDAESLARFVAAYQEGAPLALGELAALPAMLRLVLVENLRRLAVRQADTRRQRVQANRWADRMTARAEERPGDLILVVADMVRDVQPMSSGFVAELARRLQGRGGPLTQALQWIATRLADEGRTIDQAMQADVTQQAADDVSVANAIASLRLLGSMDWREFVETMSAVEQALRGDPAGVYGRMDGATRDHYRHVVARLAREAGRREIEVATEALALAAEGHDARRRHVGHYLAGEGLPQLKQRLNLRPGRVSALPAYLGAVAACTAAFAGAAAVHAAQDGAGPALLVAIGLLGALGASRLALALVDLMAARLVAPAPLPRMDFGAGIPSDARAIVAVPALLYSRDNVTALVQALEVHYLANRDPHLRFCLLTDLVDAPRQEIYGDADLIEQARAGIVALNAKYGECRPFLLLHRQRMWSEGEGAWIGRERKRGKLQDLNAFLLRGERAPFAVIEGAVAGLDEIRYVITLDAETRLPRDAARAFVAAMAHPLNHPVLDDAGRRVVAGHGLLQPRMTAALPQHGASRYERLCGGGAPGIDQDLFGAGTFAGQGIYDLAAYDRVLRGRLPDDRVLSHDLLDGCYLRAGLLGDAHLVAPCPPRYSDDVARRHRGIRGDWQLAGWLRDRVPRADGSREANPLPPLARWKLFDNLRRSLVAPTLCLLLVLCWALLPAPAFWTAAVLAVFFVPFALRTLVALAAKPHDVAPGAHLRHCAHDARLGLYHALLDTAFLPHEASYSVDAIARGAWRMLVSKRQRLEWRAPSLSRSSTDMESNWQNMWFAPAFAVGVAVLLSFANPLALFAAAPLLLLWFLSPVVAWWVSLPAARHEPHLADVQRRFLRTTARRTWAFFEDHVTAENNWLPPDHLQEHPAPVVAHRTSPAGMGVALLANLTAWDFGYAAPGELLARTRATLQTMGRLERQRGLFHDAYDTLTLEPLPPLSVSATGSGNLAAHLLTLAAGLERLADEPIASSRALDGIRDTLDVVEEHAAPSVPAVREAIAALRLHLTPERCRNAGTLPGLADCLQALARQAEALVTVVPDDADPLLRDWAARLARQAAATQADLLAMAPWMRVVQEYVIDSSLTRIPTVRELAAFGMKAPGDDLEPEERTRQLLLAGLVAEGSTNARERLQEIDQLARAARDCADMDLGMLADGEPGLLASTARLAGFVGIARGQLAQEHWYALGRQSCRAYGQHMLLSANGALDAYLAPLLVMPTYRDTLLDQTYRGIVRAQAEYGRRRDVPWGFASSGCNAMDAALQYQCRAFGVPGTGVQRAEGEDLVVAPYAAMLALMVEPERACANLERMAQLGFTGRYGFYEAIDYTPARRPAGQAYAIVRAFMAHHQGMGFLALSCLLHDRPMQRRFAAEPQFQATLPLLQEPVPLSRGTARMETEDARHGAPDTATAARTVTQPDAAPQDVQLLSNGRYHVMVTASGAGYSAWRDASVTRWRADPTADDSGHACYVRDVDSGAVWSNTWRPTLARPEHYEARFSEGRAAFRRRDHGIELHTEIIVAPDDDVELRRLRIANRTGATRTIELTSYAEVVPAAVQMEIVEERDAILCARGQEWLLNAMTVHGVDAPGVDAPGVDAPAAQFGTDRAHFIGRGRSRAHPAALDGRAPLGGAAGAVPDPALAIRRVLTLAPHQEVTIDVVLGVAETRDHALRLIDKYRDRDVADRVPELAWTHGQVMLRQLNASEADAQLYARLAGSVLCPQTALRADPALIARNQCGRPDLEALGIPGDRPLVLLHLRDVANIDLARQAVQAYAWWRAKGLAANLVVWCDGPAALQDEVMRLPGAGGVYVCTSEQLSLEERMLMQAVARVVLADDQGGLAEQLRRAAARKVELPPALEPTAAPDQNEEIALPVPELVQDNGIGGFTADGREYVIRTGPDQRTPAPWVNVLASPMFGTVISESGQAYSWNQNAHEFRLTPWDGGPAVGEAFYVRDEQTGVFWSPTALPAPSGADYVTRHGFGYSVFEHAAHGIRSELLTYVALDAPLKHIVLKLRNDSSVPRRLSVTGYVEWVLGELRAGAAPHVVTEQDPVSGALFARNAWNADFAGRVAFFHLDAEHVAFTCDRAEFIGPDGSLANPAALGRTTLSGRSGAALDPCAALQTVVDLAPGEEQELVFMLGVGGRRNLDATGMVQRHSGLAAAAADLARVRDFWDDTLGAVRIETPEPAFDVLANGWLMYQAIACRMWARSSHDQSVGAYRFRDQLQDAMAAVHVRPELLRDHILLFAGHQFVEGDVQHWWHPPTGRGERTRRADDALWLPLAVHRYVGVTGDYTLLDEIAPFVEGRALRQDEAAYCDLPDRSQEQASIYEHCVRALRQALVFGPHGLPPMSAGGESVRLGFFLYDVLCRFAELADRRGDYGFCTTCRSAAQVLAHNIDGNAWDGAWYRRGYGDDGAGCIDAGTQSWAVLSGAADRDRARIAMDAVDAQLMRDGGVQDTQAAIWAAMAYAHLGDTERAWELARMLDPAGHARAEPYVMTAGRDSGSWYAGSAGWMYRLIVESLLGVTRAGETLTLMPRLPAAWEGFRLHYRYRGSQYMIAVRRADEPLLYVDGVAQQGNTIALVDDGRTHEVELHVAGHHDNERNDTPLKFVNKIISN
ncbi:cyclic beta 1-2 glucan synthetase [Telluria mixta]|uniref:Cyclic beta 1-2 glucan synthetase n=1 Tax=Telluria mixta TaxID=34071 RepID=A0ABT2BVD2_9BURK|nr:glucoamylase family protein [Telluria mixta]MCS0629093.1 cyclic beta 1-2 glucan synthetase [Telluria mixta]WEM97537.1 glucoamylase family protein [Telluria mixta]